jgi:hypothetical protein
VKSSLGVLSVAVYGSNILSQDSDERLKTRCDHHAWGIDMDGSLTAGTKSIKMHGAIANGHLNRDWAEHLAMVTSCSRASFARSVTSQPQLRCSC